MTVTTLASERRSSNGGSEWLTWIIDYDDATSTLAITVSGQGGTATLVSLTVTSGNRTFSVTNKTVTATGARTVLITNKNITVTFDASGNLTSPDMVHELHWTP